LKDMVAVGRLSGVEIGFLGHMAHNLGARLDKPRSQLSVIKARITEADGSTAIYRQE
jgi:hypothetical protein